jgi:hypothetical protein
MEPEDPCECRRQSLAQPEDPLQARERDLYLLPDSWPPVGPPAHQEDPAIGQLLLEPCAPVGEVPERKVKAL